MGTGAGTGCASVWECLRTMKRMARKGSMRSSRGCFFGGGGGSHLQILISKSELTADGATAIQAEAEDPSAEGGGGAWGLAPDGRDVGAYSRGTSQPSRVSKGTVPTWVPTMPVIPAGHTQRISTPVEFFPLPAFCRLCLWCVLRDV